MGYALPGGGGRGGGVWWALAATVAAVAVTHTAAQWTPVRPGPVVAAVARAAAPTRVQLRYRDAEGAWRTLRAPGSGRFAGMSAEDWRRAMPGFRVTTKGQRVTLVEDGGKQTLPYFVGIGQGRVSIWAGTPQGLRVEVDTTPILAGTLPPRDLDRLRRTVRVHSVAEGWRVLAAISA